MVESYQMVEEERDNLKREKAYLTDKLNAAEARERVLREADDKMHKLIIRMLSNHSERYASFLLFVDTMPPYTEKYAISKFYETILSKWREAEAIEKKPATESEDK